MTDDQDSPKRPPVIVIGAGISGLACARKLADAGLSVIVLDKGRGIGGRVATRRAEGLHFDHGAQYISALDNELTRAVAGSSAPWQDGIVGTPGMSALAKALGAGLDIRQNMQVTGLIRQAAGWRVQIGDSGLDAERVIVTVPAPQVAGLLGVDHPLVAQITGVAYAPNLTLMAAITGPAPFITVRDPDAGLAWIAQDSTKPDRPQTGATAWVAQASTAFSMRHLEKDNDAIAALMLPLLCDMLGAASGNVSYVSAHRWRYAFVTAALSQPFARADDTTLYLGGDWCLGPKVEHAFTSGQAIADDILTQLA